MAFQNNLPIPAQEPPASLPSSSSGSEIPRCNRFGSSDRRKRSKFTAWQLDVLETRFEVQPKPGHHDRVLLACLTDIPEDRIQLWFRNRRAKARRANRENCPPAPSFGLQPPHQVQPPSFGLQPLHPVQPPSFGLQPLHPVQPPSFGLQPLHPVQPPSFGLQPLHPVQPPSFGLQPLHPVQPPSFGLQPPHQVQAWSQLPQMLDQNKFCHF